MRFITFSEPVTYSRYAYNSNMLGIYIYIYMTFLRSLFSVILCVVLFETTRLLLYMRYNIMVVEITLRSLVFPDIPLSPADHSPETNECTYIRHALAAGIWGSLEKMLLLSPPASWQYNIITHWPGSVSVLPLPAFTSITIPNLFMNRIKGPRTHARIIIYICTYVPFKRRSVYISHIRCHKV